VAIKLLIEDLVYVGPVASLVVIAVCFTVGIIASIQADRRDPDAERKREERMQALREGGEEARPHGAQDGAGGERPQEEADRERASSR
jgi:hypothetical protein